MTKYLLTTEFRYNSIPKGEFDGGCNSRTITNGVFDNIDDALNKGNEVLNCLIASGRFRIYDCFKKKGFLGRPTDLVCDFNEKHKVSVYVKINNLHFDDVNDVMKDVFTSQDAYNKWLDD